MMGNCWLLSRWVRLSILVIALGARDCAAELLIYEGYNGYSTGTGTLNGVKPNSNTIGLDQTQNYAGTGPAVVTVNASGIVFSPNFVSSGGSIGMIGTGAAVLAAQIDLINAPPTGTLYTSYLVNFAGAHSTASGEGTHTRIGNDATTGGSRLQAYADSRSGTATTTGVAYGGTIVSSAETLTVGTSYLLISSFTNINTTLSAGTTGVGTTYALSAAQYDSFLAAGATESYLQTTAIGTGAGQITSRISASAVTSGSVALVDGNFAQFVTVGSPLALDELRYGTTLADVVAAVPEPSSVALIVCGLAGCLAVRRFRCVA